MPRNPFLDDAGKPLDKAPASPRQARKAKPVNTTSSTSTTACKRPNPFAGGPSHAAPGTAEPHHPPASAAVVAAPKVKAAAAAAAAPPRKPRENPFANAALEDLDALAAAHLLKPALDSLPAMTESQVDDLWDDTMGPVSDSSGGTLGGTKPPAGKQTTTTTSPAASPDGQPMQSRRRNFFDDDSPLTTPTEARSHELTAFMSELEHWGGDDGGAGSNPSVSAGTVRQRLETKPGKATAATAATAATPKPKSEDGGWARAAKRAPTTTSAGRGSGGDLAADFARLIAEKVELLEQIDALKTTVPPKKAVRLMSQGRDVPLEPYKDLRSKLELLDEAVAQCSGSLITRLVIFLRKTLRSKIFFLHMRKRRVAARNYAAFLLARHEWDDLIAFLSAIGWSEKLVEVRFKRALLERDCLGRSKDIAECISLCTQKLETETVPALEDYEALLKVQEKIERIDAAKEAAQSEPLFQKFPRKAAVPFTSAVATLYYSALYHYSVPDAVIASPVHQRQLLKLNDKQYTWTVARALAHARDWKHLEALVTVKTMLRSTKIKPCIGTAALAHIVTQARAPPQVIRKYLELISDSEAKFTAAKHAACHELAVQALIELKDSQRLREYRSEAGFTMSRAVVAQIDSVLSNPTIRWRT